MTKPAITQSQKRFQESLSSQFSAQEQSPTCLFLKSSSDVGVIRNGGRNGARFAPQSFLATFKKFTQDKTTQGTFFKEFEVANINEEEGDFHLAQTQEALRIADLIKQYPQARVYHIGGGHDHIYPLLKAASADFKKVVVLNVDAHADTRTDDQHHSGTPFRQFAREFEGEFSLFQLGLNSFANSFSTLAPLEHGQMHILWQKDLNSNSLDKFFIQMGNEIDEHTLLIFSLDADALCGFEVPGVSAVNATGIERSTLLDIWKRYSKLSSQRPLVGIYELNPLYDTLSALSMRTIASFVFESFE